MDSNRFKYRFDIDASDRDPHIYPNEAIKACMRAMDRLGFRLMKADVEELFARTELPFYLGMLSRT